MSQHSDKTVPPESGVSSGGGDGTDGTRGQGTPQNPAVSMPGVVGRNQPMFVMVTPEILRQLTAGIPVPGQGISAVGSVEESQSSFDLSVVASELPSAGGLQASQHASLPSTAQQPSASTSEPSQPKLTAKQAKDLAFMEVMQAYDNHLASAMAEAGWFDEGSWYRNARDHDLPVPSGVELFKGGAFGAGKYVPPNLQLQASAPPSANAWQGAAYGRPPANAKQSRAPPNAPTQPSQAGSSALQRRTYPSHMPRGKEHLARYDMDGNCYLDKGDWGSFGKGKSTQQVKLWMEQHGLSAVCAECIAKQAPCDHVWPCTPCKLAGLPCSFILSDGSHGGHNWTCKYDAKCEQIHEQNLFFFKNVLLMTLEQFKDMYSKWWSFPEGLQMGTHFGTTDASGKALGRKSAPLPGIANERDLTLYKNKFRNRWGYQYKYPSAWIRRRFYTPGFFSEKVEKAAVEYFNSLSQEILRQEARKYVAQYKASYPNGDLVRKFVLYLPEGLTPAQLLVQWLPVTEGKKPPVKAESPEATASGGKDKPAAPSTQPATASTGEKPKEGGKKVEEQAQQKPSEPAQPTQPASQTPASATGATAVLPPNVPKLRELPEELRAQYPSVVEFYHADTTAYMMAVVDQETAD